MWSHWHLLRPSIGRHLLRKSSIDRHLLSRLSTSRHLLRRLSTGRQLWFVVKDSMIGLWSLARLVVFGTIIFYISFSSDHENCSAKYKNTDDAADKNACDGTSAKSPIWLRILGILEFRIYWSRSKRADQSRCRCWQTWRRGDALAIFSNSQ